jgi:hypothetical protein
LTDDLKRIVSAVYRSGKGGTLSTVEFVNILSYNLRFFTPDRAKKVHQAALGSGLLLPDGSGSFSPSFRVEEVQVEPDYRPAPDLSLETLTRSMSDRLIDMICRSGMEKKDAIKAINRTSENLNLMFAAAAVHVAIESGSDMSAFYNEVETSFLVPSG